jgi:hypothetical protein
MRLPSFQDTGFSAYAAAGVRWRNERKHAGVARHWTDPFADPEMADRAGAS